MLELFVQLFKAVLQLFFALLNPIFLQWTNFQRARSHASPFVNWKNR